jgi:hypothetical protein
MVRRLLVHRNAEPLVIGVEFGFNIQDCTLINELSAGLGSIGRAIGL